MNIQGGGCVSVLEGATDTVIETNYCTGQSYKHWAGINSRASSTVIRYNKAVSCKGTGVRLSGHRVGSDRYGTTCKVRVCASSYVLREGCLGPESDAFLLLVFLALLLLRLRALRGRRQNAARVLVCTIYFLRRRHVCIETKPCPPFQVYCNILKGNEYGGVKVMVGGNQICQNTVTGKGDKVRGCASSPPLPVFVALKGCA